MMQDLTGSQWRWMRVGGDVLPGHRAGENPDSTVLDKLEPAKGFAGIPEQDSITVAQAGGDRGMDEFL